MNKTLDRYFTGNKDAERLIQLAKSYFHRGATALEPFAGHMSIVWADRGMHFKWTTNDIVSNKFLDSALDYHDIPVKNYDVVITNPPFSGGIDNLIEILNHFSQYTNDIFMVVHAFYLKKRTLQKIYDNKWIVLEDIPSTNHFYSEEHKKNRIVRCRLVHFHRCHLMVRHLCHNPKIIKTDEFDADFHIAYIATDVGQFVPRDYAYKKHSIKILDPEIKEYVQKHQHRLGNMMCKYAKAYSANMFRIDLDEINHFISSCFLADNFLRLQEGVPFLKVVKR